MEFDYSERPPAGTRCFVCRNDHRHFCAAEGYWNEVPLCRSCGEGKACDRQKAVAQRLSAMTVFDVPVIAPVRIVELSLQEKAPKPASKWVSEWRKSIHLDIGNVAHMK